MKISRNTVSFFLCLFLFGTMLFYPSSVSEYARQGMYVSVFQVIPSIFPFAVLSSLAVNATAAAPSSLRKILPVSVGFLCGFPLGAKTAIELYECGDIDENELKYLLPLSNNTGPAFVIGVLGGATFASYAVGVLVYVCQILSALTVGLMFCITRHKKKSVNKKFRSSSATPFFKAFPQAVTSSASSMLTVCGFITFFRVLLGILSDWLAKAGVPKKFELILAIFFEMSCAVSQSATLAAPYPRIALALAAFAVSWAGISVHFQVSVFLKNGYCGYGYYVLFKLLQGCVAAVLAFFLSPIVLPLSQATAAVSLPVNFVNMQLGCIIFLYGCAAVILQKCGNT